MQHFKISKTQRFSIMRYFFSILLRPLAVLYQLITDFRNQLYDKQLKPSFSFDKIAVINVGNLRVGGTGKSPMVEYLLRLLSEHKLGTISRGYKRKTKGVLLANENSMPEDLGDEPYQFHRKFKEVQVCVGEERPLAIVTMIHERPDIDVMILDDAYQHRPVRPDLNILLTEYNRPFFEDFVLPSGRLRESRKGARRADIVVVTKTPEGLSDEEMAKMKTRIFDYNAEASVFFAGIKYGAPQSIWPNDLNREFSSQKEILSVAGIANVKPFEEHLQQKFSLRDTLRFPDHHHYKRSDFENMKRHLAQLGKEGMLLTTEKDAVKWMSNKLAEELLGDRAYYIPIEVQMLPGSEAFDSFVKESVENILQEKAIP